ncbi:MAG TPA: hypothetical protein VFR46_06685 [Actinomycetes bacterium]|nr:hypothetical protein [Actinomycetes bacterium]
MRRWAAAALIGGIALGAAGWAPAAVASPPGGSGELFVIADPRITEASGLALSGRHQGVLWMNNDSGAPQLFGVGFDGGVVAVATLEGAENVDWEAVARGPNNTLWVGDIGDNDVLREEIVVYRIDEPDLGDTSVAPTRFVLRYPDGLPHDAEALLVNPVTGRLWIATKEIFGGGLYEAPEQLSTEGVNELVRIRDVPAVVTDGTWSADGQLFVLRDYGRAWIYDPAGNALGAVELPGQDQGQNQGESVTFGPSGVVLLSGTEQANSTIWEIPLAGAGPPTGADGGGGSGATGAVGTSGGTSGDTDTDPDTAAAGDQGGIITNTNDPDADDDGGVSPTLIAILAAIAIAFLIGRRRGRKT